MAENPFAKFAPSKVDPANPFAKFAPAPVPQGPSVTEDIANIAVPSAIRGTLGLLTTPGSLDDLAGKGIDWVHSKVSPEGAANLEKKRAEVAAQPPGILDSVKNVTGAWRNLFPTYTDTLKKVEDNVTGKLPRAQTAGGRIVETGLEVAPSLMTGGVLPAIPKAIGAGLGAEGLGQAADAVKKYLPESWQPVAEPIARGVGAVGGTALPALLRRGVTPLPMSDDQFATVNALRARDPNFPMSAGQATQSPRLMNLEARSPRMQNMAENQDRAFTQAAMREAGITGDFRNIAQGAGIGAELGAIRRGNNINSSEFANLNSLVSRERLNLMRSADREHLESIDDVRRAIALGVNQNPAQPPLNMTGPRYEHLRQRIQGQIDRGGTSDEVQALSRVREGLDNAFYNSVPPEVAARARELGNQYANYNTLANIPPKAGRQTVTPQEVKSAVGHHFGNKAANEGRGTLAPLADDASAVMTPHPTPSGDAPHWFKSALTGLGTLAGGGAAHMAGQTPWGTAGVATAAGVGGNVAAPLLYNMGAGLAGRAVSSAPAQAYLANQLWRPGAASTTDAATMARLLMSPTQQPALPPPGP